MDRHTPHSTPAEQIAAALARAQPKTFAAPHDPYRIDRVLRAELAQHRAHLNNHPPNVDDRLAEASAAVLGNEIWPSPGVGLPTGKTDTTPLPDFGA